MMRSWMVNYYFDRAFPNFLIIFFTWCSMEQHFWIEALDDFDVTCEKYEILIAKIRLLGKPRYFQIDKS